MRTQTSSLLFCGGTVYDVSGSYPTLLRGSQLAWIWNPDEWNDPNAGQGNSWYPQADPMSQPRARTARSRRSC